MQEQGSATRPANASQFANLETRRVVGDRVTVGDLTKSRFGMNPDAVLEAAASLGWSLEESGVRLMYRSAVDLYLDEWVYELVEAVESSNAARVCINGLANLRASTPDLLRFKEYLYSFVQRCSRQGITLMMSLESPELFGLTRLTDMAISQIADNVVLLPFVRGEWEYTRALTFLKSRATAIPLRTGSTRSAREESSWSRVTTRRPCLAPQLLAVRGSEPRQWFCVPARRGSVGSPLLDKHILWERPF